MLGLTHKPKRIPVPAVHFLVYRSRRCDLGGSMGFAEPATKAQALRAFDACVAKGDITPTNGRRVLVTGPDYRIQPDDHHDPLLIGVAAVKAVLKPYEFEAFCAQTAQYALEAE